MIRVTTVRLVLILAVVCLSISFGTRAHSAEYIIGTGDVLDVGFWQEPTLNTQVTVGQDGKITLDVIGQIDAAGLTTDKLQNEVVRQMSRLNRNISQATVRVAVFSYNHVYVIGQVNTPGKMAFEEIPDLWTIINESGGVAEAGDLSRVTIIRGGDDAGEIEVVNVSDALARGELDKLPKLRRLDTIEIPRTPGAVFSGDVARSAEKKNLIYVIGAVNTPGPVGYEDNIDVAEALAYAGGPSEMADLSKIQLILKDGHYSQTVRFDLDKYSQSGKPGRYIMQKEDMLVVPTSRSGFLSENMGTIAAALGAVTTALLIYDRLSSDDGSSSTSAP